MADRDRSAGVLVVAGVAAVLGVLHLASGTLALAMGSSQPAGAVLAGSRTVLGVILLPTAVGLARGAPWSRALGLVAFGGIAVVQLLPLVAGATLAVPLAGILLAASSGLYLLLAPGEFGDESGERAVTKDTDPHDFVR